MDDREILKQFEKRSETAIEACMEKYGRILSRIAFNVLGSEQDAEECVNDALLRVWNSVPPEVPADLAAYLCRITRNLSIDRLRANKALRRGGEILQAETELLECLPARDDVEQELEEKEFTTLLDRFLEGLKPEARKLFVRRYWYLDSVRQIAKDLGVGESKVKMSLLRSRRALREFLQKEGIDV